MKFTGTLISEDEAQEMVWALPEVKSLSETIRRSGARPFTRIERDAETGEHPVPMRRVHRIYFGEDLGTHVVRIMTFILSASTGSVQVYDIVEDRDIPIEEWRVMERR